MEGERYLEKVAVGWVVATAAATAEGCKRDGQKIYTHLV